MSQGKKIFTVKELKDLGFKHQYDSEVDDKGTPDEMWYAVYALKIKDNTLEATLEYGPNNQVEICYFNFVDEVELNGRPLTAADIKLLKEIL